MNRTSKKKETSKRKRDEETKEPPCPIPTKRLKKSGEELPISKQYIQTEKSAFDEQNDQSLLIQIDSQTLEVAQPSDDAVSLCNEVSSSSARIDEKQIAKLKEYYKEIVISENEASEENWRCDICLSKQSDDDDPLTMCDLCAVVVHPTCYRRDLYSEEFQDDEPWFCARCKYILCERPAERALPSCMLCPDKKGSMVDLQTKEWVHQVCVNWHNEIWFEPEDIELRSFGGLQNMDRLSYKCFICGVMQGSCIDCDFKKCQKTFHVRCAIKAQLILSNEEMEDLRLGAWEIKVFCDKHTKCGKEKVQKLNLQKFLSQQKQDLGYRIICDQEEEPGSKGKQDRMDFLAKIQERRKRDTVINEIDVDEEDEEAKQTMRRESHAINLERNFRRQAQRGPQQFTAEACDPRFEAGRTGFKAKKSKSHTVPDPTGEAYYLTNTGMVERKEEGGGRGGRPEVKRAPQVRVEDVKIESKMKFRIEKKLADFLGVDCCCTYREFTLGLLKFHKKVMNFYDKSTSTFNVGLYPIFRQFFPDQARISSQHIKEFLIREPLFY